MYNDDFLTKEANEKFNNINIPDSLDSIINSAIQRGEEHKKSKKRMNFRRMYASAAAVFVMGIGIYTYMEGGYTDKVKTVSLYDQVGTKSKSVTKDTLVGVSTPKINGDEASSNAKKESRAIPNNDSVLFKVQNNIPTDRIKKSTTASEKITVEDNKVKLEDEKVAKNTMVPKADATRSKFNISAKQAGSNSMSTVAPDDVPFAAPESNMKMVKQGITSTALNESNGSYPMLTTLKVNSAYIGIFSVVEFTTDSKNNNTVVLQLENNIKGNIRDKVSIKTSITFDKKFKYLLFINDLDNSYVINQNTSGVISIENNDVLSEDKSIMDEINEIAAKENMKDTKLISLVGFLGE